MGGFELSGEVRETLDHIEAPGLRAVMAHWRDCLGASDVMPAKSRIDPVALGPSGILPSMWLVEVPEEGAPFYRLAGERIVKGHGKNVARRSIYEAYEAPVAAAIEQRWRRMLADHLFSHSIGEVRSETGTAFIGERVALPLTDEEGVPRFVIGSTQARLPNHPVADRALKSYTEIQSTLMPLSLLRAMA